MSSTCGAELPAPSHAARRRRGRDRGRRRVRARLRRRPPPAARRGGHRASSTAPATSSEHPGPGPARHRPARAAGQPRRAAHVPPGDRRRRRRRAGAAARARPGRDARRPGRAAVLLRAATSRTCTCASTRRQIADGVAVQVARSLDEVDHTLHRIGLYLLFIGLGGIAIASALGLLVAQATLRPVGQLTAVAEEVTRDTRPLAPDRRRLARRARPARLGLQRRCSRRSTRR